MVTWRRFLPNQEAETANLIDALCPDESSNSDPAAERPTFYLHVGLHKTGTTFLQDALSQSPQLEKEFFFADNLEYLGTCPLGRDPKYVLHGPYNVFEFHPPGHPYIELAKNGNFTEYKDDYALTNAFNFLSRVEELRKEGRNVLMVYEVFSVSTDRMVERLKQFLSPTWNVKVLVVHRFLHEWLLSNHNQLYRLIAPDYRSWTKQVKPFDLENPELEVSQTFDGVERHSTHVSQLVQRMYQRHFRDVETVSMDQLASLQKNGSKGDPLLEYVLCHFVENAPNSCAQARLGMINGQDNNTYQDNTVDLIAQEALAKGFLSKSANRKKVSESIEAEMKLQNVSKLDLPLICPSNEVLARFERVSMLADKNMHGESNWSEEKMSRHKKSFQKLVVGKKFCHVDAGTVLLMDPWKTFFNRISL